mmetsp:Transcript_725/g.1201  ORF Transcript_725/g.1201 Transcript_725/m.1201 type:complete len:421 (-) Transcript_725:275-1537(-)
MDSMRSSLDDNDLPTITEAEEDGESVRSGSTAKSPPKGTDTMTATDDLNNNEGKKEKEKKKKKKAKAAAAAAAAIYSEDHDTAQQILVDICTEMKDLKNSIQEGQEKTSVAMTSNLDSNQQVMHSLTDQMEMLQGNMKQLDQVIESKATPAQIEELARIRAVQEMMKVVTDDKERTVGVYEQHARRGYEEIERLRQDLTSERKEVAALRAELEIVRGDRQRMTANGVGGAGPSQMFVGGDGGSLGGDSGNNNRSIGPGSMYINGGPMVRRSNGGGGGDFDDMTLETKGSYDTATYEVKSLKKRIIHMKKKLTVAQMEAKEAGELRSEVERLRVQCETEKKAGSAKDGTIRRLEGEIEGLKRIQANAAAALRTAAGGGGGAGTPPTPISHAASYHPQPLRSGASKTVVTHSSKKSKWWQNI